MPQWSGLGADPVVDAYQARGARPAPDRWTVVWPPHRPNRL